MILTSHSDMLNTDTKTGVWLGEFTDPYYEFADAKYEITLASPKGGEPPIDPMSQLTENITASNRRFQDDEVAQHKFSNTKKLSEVDPEAFDAVFLPGGHGPIWDLAKDSDCGKIIISFIKAEKPVAAVCHGPAAFLAAEKEQPGFLRAKTMSCFSNTEENLVLRTEHMPYLLQDALEEKGVKIDNAVIPFTSNVKKDGLLITGQNPLSAGPTARALIEKITGQPV